MVVLTKRIHSCLLIVPTNLKANRNVESTVTTIRSQLHIFSKKLGLSVSHNEYKIKFFFNITEYFILPFADIILVIECILKNTLSVE